MSRTDFVEGSPLTRDALSFAADRHAGQTRDLEGEVPFVTHPVEVACLLHEAGYPDEVVAAGVLHDLLEDTKVQADELRGRFGEPVAELVASVSEDPSIEDEREQKAALRRQVADAGEQAAVIFTADKVSKTRELRARLDQGGMSDGDRSKLDHYRATLEILSGVVPGHELIERLRVELEQTASSLREHGHPELAGETLRSQAED